MKERWKKIKDWPFYEISDHGNVRSWKPHPKSTKTRRETPIARKPVLIKRGYFLLMLKEYKSGQRIRQKALYVHRLVATAFVKGDTTLQAAHLDGSRTNNHFSNLKWCTSRENASHKILHGTNLSGEAHPSTKLPDLAVKAILNMKKMGFEGVDIADIFEISPATICDYAAGRSRFLVVKKRSRRTHLNQEV